MYAVQDIDEAWSAIKHGVDAVIEMVSPDWNAEQLYERLKRHRAFLFMDSSDPTSFVVLEDYRCPYRGVLVLFVLAAYNKTGNAIDRYQGEIEQIAREAGCKEVEFSSPRRAFERVAAKHGYKVDTVTYRKEIDG